MRSEFAKAMRAAFEEGQRAFNAGDFDSAFAGVAEDVEWNMGAWIPDSSLLHGRSRVIDYYKRLQDAGGWQLELIDVEDLGSGVLLIEQQGTWTGRSSGISGERRFFQLWDISDGVATRVREFETREEALAAVAQAGGSTPSAA